MSSDLMKIEEIASELGISIGTAHNRLSARKNMPPSIKSGRRLLFPRKEFLLWIESQKLIKYSQNEGGIKDSLYERWV